MSFLSNIIAENSRLVTIFVKDFACDLLIHIGERLSTPIELVACPHKGQATSIHSNYALYTATASNSFCASTAAFFPE